MEHPLRSYRRRAGLSLEQLGERVAAAKSTISRVETGKQSPSLDLVMRLRDATGGAVTANDFLPATPSHQEASAS